MIDRRTTIDRELLLILLAFLLLALAARSTRLEINLDDAEATRAAQATEIASTFADAAANPYWAPAHAFTRHPAPLYSDAE